MGNTDVETLIEWGKNAGSIGEEVVTLAKKLKQEGIEEGFHKGEMTKARKTAVKMIQKKINIDTISEVTELPIKEIEELQAKNQEEY